MLEDYTEAESLSILRFSLVQNIWLCGYAVMPVPNSRWLLDRLFALCDPVTLFFDL